jgi:hypothetical protein
MIISSPTTNLPWLSATENCLLMSFSLSYRPLTWHTGNAPSNSASIVASLLKRVTSLLMWSHDPSPILCHPSVAWQQTRGGMRCATHHGMAELGSAWRKHQFVHCCVIAGTCFGVTVLAWLKYATIPWICCYRKCFLKLSELSTYNVH